MDPLLLQVLVVAVISDLATGLGALPFALMPTLSSRWEGLANAFAAGMMLSASVFTLADKALQRGSAAEVVLGLAAGAAFCAGTSHLVGRMNWTIEHLTGADARRAVVILVAMFVHSIPEGVAIGVGYATGELKYGLLLGVAIAVHNIPEGAAVALPLRAKGISVTACAGYAILTSLPQPVFAVPAFLLVETFQRLLPASLGFAGGAMIYLVAAEMLPESIRKCPPLETAGGVLAGLAAMFWLTSGMGL